MIEYRDAVIVGRHEEPEHHADRHIIAGVAEHAYAAYVALQRGMRRQIRETLDSVVGVASEDKLQEEDVFWKAWNVVVCVGRFGAWTSFDFMEVCHLGVSAAPWVTRRWRYIPRISQTDRVELPDGLGAPLIFRTSNLVSEKWVRERGRISPIRLHGTFTSRLKLCERELTNMGLDMDPTAQTRHGLREALAHRGYRLRNPNEIWESPQAGTPWGMIKLTPEEMQFQQDEPRLPHGSTIGRRWTSLDDVLARGMGQVDPRSP